MTLEQMNKAGYSQTESEIKRFNNLIAKQYKKALDDIRKDIQDLYNKITGDLTPAQVAKKIEDNPAWYHTQAMKFGRLTSLQKKVQKQYIKASIAAGNMTVESSKMAITNNFYAQQFSIDFASGKMLSFSILNPKVVEMSVLGGKVWDQIGKKYGKPGAYIPKYGTLTEVILDNRKKDLVKIRNAITQGLIQGKSYSKTAKDVKDVLDTSTSNAIRIVRTESARNMNAGAYAAHNVALSKGVPVRRKAVETLDDRTRSQSRSIDGQLTDDNDQFTYPGGLKVDIIGNSGIPAYDINERGRSVEIIEGIDQDERRGRDPLTGKSEVMSYKNYDEWMKSNGFGKNQTGRWVYRG